MGGEGFIMDFNSRMKENRKTLQELSNSHFNDLPDSTKPSKPLIFNEPSEEQLEATRQEMKLQNRKELALILIIAFFIVLGGLFLWLSFN